MGPCKHGLWACDDCHPPRLVDDSPPFPSAIYCAMGKLPNGEWSSRESTSYSGAITLLMEQSGKVDRSSIVVKKYIPETK